MRHQHPISGTYNTVQRHSGVTLGKQGDSCWFISSSRRRIIGSMLLYHGLKEAIAGKVLVRRPTG